MTAASYDGDGLRATTTFAGTTQQYDWNTTTSVPQLLMDYVSAYIYTTSGTPAEQVSLSTGTPTYLSTDRLGSVRATISSSGTLTGAASYDAWGNPSAIGGLTATTPFGYAGGYTDPDGLIYLINRYYNPATGQFTSSDPDLVATTSPTPTPRATPLPKPTPTGSWRNTWKTLAAALLLLLTKVAASRTAEVYAHRRHRNLALSPRRSLCSVSQKRSRTASMRGLQINCRSPESKTRNCRMSLTISIRQQ
jgi:RHS repeat-associated protein